jgi:cytochrome c-type biogenesis protein CcmH
MSGTRRTLASRSARRPLASLITVIAVIALWTCALAGASGTSAAQAAPPRASLPEIEREVMCVTCKIPLNVAQSPQADRERAFIQSLIDEGRSEAQIKDALVGQYGRAALALPSNSGFDAAAYLVPLAALLALLAALALLLPRWRRRARAQADGRTPAPALGAADAQRLEADLERFD